MSLGLGEHLLRLILIYANKINLEPDNIINVLAINIQTRSFSLHTLLSAIALKVEFNYVNNASFKLNKVKQNSRMFLLPQGSIRHLLSQRRKELLKIEIKMRGRCGERINDQK